MLQKIEASEPAAPVMVAAAEAIVRPGVNCWRRPTSRRASVLIDAEQYFRQLGRALRKAARSIMIVGWDFDGGIRLCPEDCEDQPRLGDFLRGLVEERPDLEIHILVWSFAVVHAPGAPLPLLFGAKWQEHPRIRVKLDTKHPIYAAHHQKIVCIDENVAFVGGIDLTTRRWDTCKHLPDDAHRKTYDGTTYGPVHDMQMLLDGEAAKAVSEVARERWKIATGDDLAPRPGTADIWPEELAVDFADEPIAIARTAPHYGGRRGRREGARLTRDAIDGARHRIYIEAQYLTARYVRAAIGRSLQRADGPEILIVLTNAINGFLERIIMGKNGDRLMSRLGRLDRHGRLMVYHPVAMRADGHDCPILIHSKLVIVDDRFIRVGSSNLNNRSVGLDTELDVAIESDRPETTARIAAIRDTLIGEHVATPADVVAETIAEEGGSMLRAVERLNVHSRALRAFPALKGKGPVHSVPGTWLLDPRKPFQLFGFLRRKAR